jgi:hypothetical protein
MKKNEIKIEMIQTDVSLVDVIGVQTVELMSIEQYKELYGESD